MAQLARRWMILAVFALGVLLPAARPTLAAEPLCFNQPGVNDCVAAEFSDYWKANGGLAVLGYPIGPAKQEQTPEGTFLVQYFERQRLELHPEIQGPFRVLLGRINDEVLRRENRDWRSFPVAPAGPGCATFKETGHSVCGLFLKTWQGQGLDLGERGVTFGESLALWGLPLSSPIEEINLDGDKVLTQHFERARMEIHRNDTGVEIVLFTRIGVALLPLELKLLAVNDFHGQISTGRRVSNKDAGGAAYLAAYLNQRRAQAPYSLTVHAGDMIGASPPSSALLQDQPTMDMLNRMGFNVGTLGNHEFDEGPEELMRLLKGGCHPVAGCWEGAKFPYVSANVIDTRTNQPLLPASTIINVAGARIGFIGAVLQGTPEIVVPSATANLKFLDEITAINAAAADLKAKGVRSIVVLLHQGGVQDASGKLTGPVVAIAEGLDDEIDVIASAHTHTTINATVDGKLITQAASYSTAFADISLTIDRASRDIVAKKAEIVTTFHEGMTPDAEIAKLVKEYEDKVAPQVNRVVGRTDATITAEQNAAGESALGNLIADAQRAEMSTQFAFMNPGGIRAPIEAGEVTWGDLYAVQPFGNDLVKLTLTGEQVYALLNQQWQPQQDGSVRTRFLQISGLSYTWNDANAVGQKVTEVRGPDGQPLDKAASYTATVNIFLADGGDGFTVLKSGTSREVGPVDLDALIHYVEKQPQPFSARLENRIAKQ